MRVPLQYIEVIVVKKIYSEQRSLMGLVFDSLECNFCLSLATTPEAVWGTHQCCHVTVEETGISELMCYWNSFWFEVINIKLKLFQGDLLVCVAKNDIGAAPRSRKSYRHGCLKPRTGNSIHYRPSCLCDSFLLQRRLFHMERISFRTIYKSQGRVQLGPAWVT